MLVSPAGKGASAHQALPGSPAARHLHSNAVKQVDRSPKPASLKTRRRRGHWRRPRRAIRELAGKLDAGDSGPSILPNPSDAMRPVQVPGGNVSARLYCWVLEI